MRPTMRRLGSVGLLPMVLLLVVVQSACATPSAPGSVWSCCEGDILLLLDSSGSVSNYEFTRMLHFLSDLLHPFQLGSGQVRVALIQVHTDPQVEFSFDSYSSQNAFQEALMRTMRLSGKTNTEAALQLAQRLLSGPPGQKTPPRVLLWVTDGVDPGHVEGPMAVLHEDGVFVLAVSTGQSSYQLLSQAVTPPLDQHLYFVDIDDISIITEDLRDAIIEVIHVERLHVLNVTSHSAVLQWHPILLGRLGYYRLHYTEMTRNINMERMLTLPAELSWTKLHNLQPSTPYMIRLTTHEPQETYSRTMSSSFTTLSTDVLSPEVVKVLDATSDRLHVSWTSVQSGRVVQYRVEYVSIPHWVVNSVTVSGSESSTMLTQLEPNTHYLITITAVHFSGEEGAISIRACTQEVVPRLLDLQLTQVGFDSVKVDWRSQENEVLQGYWVRWETGSYPSSSYSSSRYLPAKTLSTVLTHLSPISRVCVTPVYRTANGEGLCCTANTHA